MSPTCRAHCYAAAVERYRSTVRAKYRRNLRASRRRDFARRVRAFLVTHRVRVVRAHTGGDFYSAHYAQKWLAVVRRSPRVRFYFYTRDGTSHPTRWSWPRGCEMRLPTRPPRLVAVLRHNRKEKQALASVLTSLKQPNLGDGGPR